VINCKVIFDAGPFESGDDWLQGVAPGSKIKKLGSLH